MTRKGIILAGGTGSRLHPSTISVSKQLMPVFDKPMIYYPLCTLMQAGIREILIICTLKDQPAFETLLQDGKRWGLDISYAVQEVPNGIAQALIIAELFLEGQPCALILGDNLFFGEDLNQKVLKAASHETGAVIFGYQVKNPEHYGVIGFNNLGKVTSLEEKPAAPASNYAITGLYFYDETAPQKAKSLTPSARGELEITDLNRLYLEAGTLRMEQLSSGTTWLDTGTHRSLLQASQFVSVLEERQGLRICCPEVVALRKGWINKAQLRSLAHPLKNSSYGEYLQSIADR